MRYRILLCLLACACGRLVPSVEEGVSAELAAWRAANVSDLGYDIRFRIPSERHEAVSGRETISFSMARKADLQLDFRGDKAPTGLRVNGLDCQMDWRNEHIVLSRKYLRKGPNTVDVSFESSDRSLNRNDDYLYTLFVPDRARTAFPCFDQPDLKGRFTLSLEIPTGWETVANGPETGSEVSQGRKTVHYGQTPPLSTYLFAFTAGVWQKETRLREGKPMTMYFRETDPDKTAQADDIFDLVFKSLDWLEDYTGIPCPFEKYDFVVVPGFQFGGMEHPGAILLNDRRIFLGKTPTTAEKLSRIDLIAHETSHLWFGDGVTMRWFNDVWTKEVFANFFAARISTPLFPEVNTALRDFRSFNMNAYSEDRTLGTNAIRRELPNLSSAGLIYGNIVYDKAPVVMRMLAGILGDDAFRDGIREYLGSHMYGNADWNDLISVMDKRTPRDLRAWSRVWVEEKGMPEITWELRDTILTVRQHDPLGRGLLWPQHISFGDPYGNTAVSLWLDQPEVEVECGGEFSGSAPGQPRSGAGAACCVARGGAAARCKNAERGIARAEHCCEATCASKQRSSDNASPLGDEKAARHDGKEAAVRCCCNTAVAMRTDAGATAHGEEAARLGGQTLLLPDPDAMSYGWFRMDAQTARMALKALPTMERPEAQLSVISSLLESVIRHDPAVDPDAFAQALAVTLRSGSDPLVASAAASCLKTMALQGVSRHPFELERLLLAASTEPSLPAEIRLTILRTLTEVFRLDESTQLLWQAFTSGLWPSTSHAGSRSNNPGGQFNPLLADGRNGSQSTTLPTASRSNSHPGGQFGTLPADGRNGSHPTTSHAGSRSNARPRGMPIGSRDLLTLACELAIRMPEKYDAIRTLQESRLGNPDLLREFRFVYRAADPSKARRDSLFASLLLPENRSVEPWAAAALAYLNHPLREQDAIAYIIPALEELPEIQRTGDIFFPKDWCVSLLKGHSSPEAALALRQFLADHPDLPPLLKDKLLQAGDHLLRNTP